MSSPVIQFHCTHCQALLTVPIELAGVSGPCPTCGNTITSPKETPQAAPPPAFTPPQQPQQPPAPQPAPAPQYQPPQAPQQPDPNAAAWGALPPVQPEPSAPQLPPMSGPASAPPARLPAADSTQLPPRRTEPAPAQGSLLSGLLGTAPSEPAAQAPQSLQNKAPDLSSTSGLIPGAPRLPAMDPSTPGSSTRDSSASLGTDLLGSAKSVADPLQQARKLEKSMASEGNHATRRPLPPIPNRPSRGGNLVRLMIATLMILAFIALAGYGARKPLQQLAAQYLPQLGWGTGEDNDASGEPSPPITSTDELTSPNPTKTASGFDPEASRVPPETIVSPAETTPNPNPVPDKMGLSEPDGLPPMTSEPQATMGATEQVAPAIPTESAPPLAPTEPLTPTDPLVEVPGGMAPELKGSTPTAPLAPPSDMNLVRGVPQDAQNAAAALIEFFEASTVETKRPFILAADDSEISALIDRYYAINEPKRTEITDMGFIRRDPNPELGDGIQNVFMVASPDWAYPIPIMVQETQNGMKLDWVAMVEFKDDFLHKFASTFRSAPGRFHVGIKRSFYFDKDVPDLDNKLCFSLHPPQQHFEIASFVPKGTPLADMLTKAVSWETEMAYVIADIQWREKDGYQWIELIGVPQMNWHSQPDGGSKADVPPKATLVE